MIVIEIPRLREKWRFESVKREMSQMQQQTRDNLRRIDEQLDALVGLSQQQRIVATSIGTELNDQMDMLSEVDSHMDKTYDQVSQANGMLDVVKEKSGTWCAWILMALLVIAIVAVWVIPLDE